jgi:hypothetical protein
MEPSDYLRNQIVRYRRLLENMDLNSAAADRVKASLTELEEQLRMEIKASTCMAA